MDKTKKITFFLIALLANGCTSVRGPVPDSAVLYTGIIIYDNETFALKSRGTTENETLFSNSVKVPPGTHQTVYACSTNAPRFSKYGDNYEVEANYKAGKCYRPVYSGRTVGKGVTVNQTHCMAKDLHSDDKYCYESSRFIGPSQTCQAVIKEIDCSKLNNILNGAQAQW